MSDERVMSDPIKESGQNESVDILRRSLLNCVAGGAVAGALPAGGLAADSGQAGGQATASGARTWMSDEVPGKPLHDICLPGTHHAAMHGCGANYWWHTQDANVRTQLEDGIRYLDIRPGVYYDAATLVDSGVADQLSAEWTALIDEAGSVANLIPTIGDGIDDTLVGVIDSLVSFEDPDWVAEKYVESCSDSGTGGELPIDALLVRVLASLFGEFDVPDYGLDLDTIRLDRAANVDLDRDGFREHHGGDQARPYDWGAPLDESFGGMEAYLDGVDSEGASEVVILQVKQFWDLLEIELAPEDWQAFADLLDATLGEYILDLSAYSPEAFAALSPEDLDGPRVAVLMDGPDASVWEPPAWAGDLGYVTDHFPSKTEPGDVLDYAITHTERRTHDSTGLDRIEFQVTPDTDTVVDVTIETVDIRSEYDSRLLYSNLLEAAKRSNAVLDGYIDAVRRDPDQNPNIISVDFYDRSSAVKHCRALSREGIIDGNPVETPVLPAGEYRLTSVETNRAVAVDGGLTTAQRETGDDQRFRLVPEDTGRYRVEHAQSGDVLTGGGDENGDSIGLSAWQDSPDQRWFVAKLADWTHALVNQGSGRALDSTSEYEGYADGRVLQWHLHAQANQRWLLEPLNAEPPPAVGTTPPQDLDGDGLYENVRGDGEFDIADVQALFDNLDSDAVQKHANRYNFSGTDPAEVAILDVQALFNLLSES